MQCNTFSCKVTVILQPMLKISSRASVRLARILSGWISDDIVSLGSTFNTKLSSINLMSESARCPCCWVILCKKVHKNPEGISPFSYVRKLSIQAKITNYLILLHSDLVEGNGIVLAIKIRVCLYAGAHREIFFRMGRFSERGRPQTLSIKKVPMFNPIAYGLFLTTTVLAIIIVILAVEKIWLMKKSHIAGSEKYRTSSTDL